MTVRRAFLALSLSWAALSAVPAQAQPADVRTRAAEHFDRGITFFEEQRFDAALAEFSRAHELMPAPATLYNLARVHAALGHAVEAARAYEQYLADGGDALPARRRREAERALVEQRARIGRLVVRADVDGARVALDGVDVATTPLASPLAVSAGSHTVEVRAPGRETVRRAVAVAGQEEVLVEVSLREEIVPRGTLRVSTSIPEVAIDVDGERVGHTPLPSTVPLRAGVHRVLASRPGYRTEARDVLIEDGAEAEVHFDLRRDPAAPSEHLGRVRLGLPPAPYLLRVDGEPMVGLDLELPVGGHRIELEVTDRLPYQGSLHIASGRTVDITPPLGWTLEARRQRLDGASSQRSAGIALTVAGGVLALVGVPLAIWNEAEIARTDERLLEVQRQYDALGCDGLGEELRCEALRQEGAQLDRQQGDQNVLRAITVTTALTGLVLAGIGIPLWVSAPSEADIDRAARARLELGPGRLTLRGWF
jgi:hypothetical protein